MLRWLGNALASSIGKKVVMGSTGLLLVGFLVEHLWGNLSLYRATDGSAFNAYVANLKSWGALLTLAEVGLALLFICHIYLAFRLTLENREARRERYQIRNDHGRKTLASASMFATGALLTGYLVKHLLDFRFNGAFHRAPAAAVAERLSSPGHAIVYVAAALLVGVHLSHGLRSAFQSLGLSHPRLVPLLDVGGKVLAVLFALGFASFPIYFLFFHGGE
jgi:succinate dehydrogenase / fumarate reductase cytochrome b subunit